MKHPQPGLSLAITLYVPITGKKPLGEKQYEQIDRKGEMINRFKNLKVMLNHPGQIIKLNWK
jgi:hypothetical protein